MNIACQPSDLIAYMSTVTRLFRGRMPQISEHELGLIKTAIVFQEQCLNGKRPKIQLEPPFMEMNLNELFSLVVRCADCGFSLSQALSARLHDGIHR